MRLYIIEKQHINSKANTCLLLLMCLKCTLKPVLLNFTSQGLPFLGYRLFPSHVKLLHKSKIRFIHKINRAKTDLERGLITESKYQQKILPLLSFIFKANTQNFRKSISLGL